VQWEQDIPEILIIGMKASLLFCDHGAKSTGRQRLPALYRTVLSGTSDKKKHPAKVVICFFEIQKSS
jgi:hypothetical protein